MQNIYVSVKPTVTEFVARNGAKISQKKASYWISILSNSQSNHINRTYLPDFKTRSAAVSKGSKQAADPNFEKFWTTMDEYKQSSVALLFPSSLPTWDHYAMSSNYRMKPTTKSSYWSMPNQNYICLRWRNFPCQNWLSAYQTCQNYLICGQELPQAITEGSKVLSFISDRFRIKRGEKSSVPYPLSEAFTEQSMHVPFNLDQLWSLRYPIVWEWVVAHHQLSMPTQTFYHRPNLTFTSWYENCCK